MFELLKIELEENKLIAIICDISQGEGIFDFLTSIIIFQNLIYDGSTGNTENYYYFTKHIRSDKIYILLNRKENNSIFVRDFYDYDNYEDWETYKIINFKEVLREEKIKEIFK